jgi:hypothetical protein
MAVKLDGRVLVGGKQKDSLGKGFYGSNTRNTNSAGFLALENQKDLAQLVVKAFIESPQYLLEANDEADAITKGFKSGQIYKTPGGEIRIKL